MSQYLTIFFLFDMIQCTQAGSAFNSPGTLSTNDTDTDRTLPFSLPPSVVRRIEQAGYGGHIMNSPPSVIDLSED